MPEWNLQGELPFQNGNNSTERETTKIKFTDIKDPQLNRLATLFLGPEDEIKRASRIVKFNNFSKPQFISFALNLIGSGELSSETIESLLEIIWERFINELDTESYKDIQETLDLIILIPVACTPRFSN